MSEEEKALLVKAVAREGFHNVTKSIWYSTIVGAGAICVALLGVMKFTGVFIDTGNKVEAAIAIVPVVSKIRADVDDLKRTSGQRDHQIADQSAAIKRVGDKNTQILIQLKTQR